MGWIDIVRDIFIFGIGSCFLYLTIHHFPRFLSRLRRRRFIKKYASSKGYIFSAKDEHNFESRYKELMGKRIRETDRMKIKVSNVIEIGRKLWIGYVFDVTIPSLIYLYQGRSSVGWLETDRQREIHLEIVPVITPSEEERRGKNYKLRRRLKQDFLDFQQQWYQQRGLVEAPLDDVELRRRFKVYINDLSKVNHALTPSLQSFLLSNSLSDRFHLVLWSTQIMLEVTPCIKSVEDFDRFILTLQQLKTVI